VSDFLAFLLLNILLSLIMAIPMLLLRGVQALNVMLWVTLHYPNRQDWPNDAHKAVYLPKGVALGFNPLLTTLGCIVAAGILLRLVGSAAELKVLQVLGNLLAGYPGLMFLLCLLRIVWEVSEGFSPMEERNVRAFQSLKSKIKVDTSDDMLPLYRLWHTFFSHDRLLTRFSTSLAKYRRKFDGLVFPEELAEKIEREIERLREEYSTALVSERVPANIKKVARRRRKNLDSLPKFEVD
jgi:hypothetical protein